MKLQFWSFDVIFAIVIFSVAITILAFTWYDISNQLSLVYGSGSTLMGIQAQTLIQNILSPGSPGNWNSMVNLTNVTTWGNVGIGLGEGGSISSSKLYTFMAMANQNYEAAKQDLGVSYDFYIEIYNNNMNITIGKNPSENNAFTVDVATATSSINGSPVTVKALVWTNTALGIG